jgi:2,5-diketo-D-gluconate reductase A
MRENFAIFDFELAPQEMETITALDRGQRVGPDPETFDRV